MSNLPQTVTEDGEIITGLPAGYDAAAGANQSLAVSLARAEVDQQIATARAMPRSIDRAVKNIMTLSTLDEQSAEECVYALPRGGKPITGPSVRLAEIIASQWGNCRVGARVVHVDRFEKFIEAEGVFHDLETNTATTARVRRRISDKQGRLLSDDMIVVTGNAACAIAKRNAILGAVPKAVWRKAYDAVEGVVKGDVKTLTERRTAAFTAFAAWGVTPEQICAALNVGGVDDINLDHLATLTGMRSAIKSGEATVEEMFPAIGSPAAAAGKKRGTAALDDVAKGGKAADTKQPEQTAATDGQGDAGKAEKAADGAKGAGAGKTAATDAGNGQGDGPTQADIDAAEAAGGEAFRNGRAKKAVPDRFKGTPALSDAWQRGWQTSKDEAPE